MKTARLALLLCLVVIPALAQDSGSKKLTNTDVVDMVKAGLDSATIAAKIQNSDTAFNTDPPALKELKDSGVPDAVILEVVKATTTKTPAPLPPAPESSSVVSVLANHRLIDVLEGGGMWDLEGKKKAVLLSDDSDAYEIINRQLEGCDCVDIVHKPEKAEFVILYIGRGAITGMSRRLFGYGLVFDGVNSGTFLVFTLAEDSTPEKPRVLQVFKRQNSQAYVSGVTFQRHPAYDAVRDFIKVFRRVSK